LPGDGHKTSPLSSTVCLAVRVPNSSNSEGDKARTILSLTRRRRLDPSPRTVLANSCSSKRPSGFSGRPGSWGASRSCCAQSSRGAHARAAAGFCNPGRPKGCAGRALDALEHMRTLESELPPRRGVRDCGWLSRITARQAGTKPGAKKPAGVAPRGGWRAVRTGNYSQKGRLGLALTWGGPHWLRRRTGCGRWM